MFDPKQKRKEKQLFQDSTCRLIESTLYNKTMGDLLEWLGNYHPWPLHTNVKSMIEPVSTDRIAHVRVINWNLERMQIYIWRAKDLDPIRVEAMDLPVLIEGKPHGQIFILMPN